MVGGGLGGVLGGGQGVGLGGVVGKRAGLGYEQGERSGAWIKQRADRSQEFVIGGYVPGSRGFDSLLVGVYEKKELRFIAKVKDGFVPRMRDEIFPQLEQWQAKQCPFANLPEKKGARLDALTADKMKQCRWLKPRLVCQVGFAEWTEAGNLRHATFLGLRAAQKARAGVRGEISA